MLLASLAVAGVGKRLGDAGVMRLGLFSMAAGYALLYFARDLGTTMAFLGVPAFGVPFASAGFQTLMQKNAPLEMMGRIGAVRGTLVLGAMPLSTAVAGALGERIHAPVLFGALGVLIFICTAVITFDRVFRQSGRAYREGAVTEPGGSAGGILRRGRNPR